jgi:hypothetical protein
MFGGFDAVSKGRKFCEKLSRERERERERVSSHREKEQCSERSGDGKESCMNNVSEK